MIRTRKAQAWSIDIVIAVVLFVAAFMFFYIIIGSSPTTEKTAILIEDGEQLAGVLTSDGKLSVVHENKLSGVKTDNVAGISYQEIKKLAGLRSDFCVHFEDEDGNIVDVDGVTSIGDPRVNITFASGRTVYCGER